MPQFEMRLYKYDRRNESDNYRGTNYTNYILQGTTITEDLTEVMDTVTLTLSGLTFQKEFEPSTKFILEYWQKIDDDFQMVKDYHLIVESDYVEQPILSDDEYYNHHISFIEASALAQGRIVDDISITYKLKDVSLDSKTIYNLDTKATYSRANVEYIPSEDQQIREGELLYPSNVALSRRYIWDFSNTSEASWKNFDYYQGLTNASTTRQVTFTAPYLHCLGYGGRQNGVLSWGEICQCSVLATVYEINVSTGKQEEILSQRIDPTDTFYDYSYNYRTTDAAYPYFPKYCIQNRWVVNWKGFPPSRRMRPYIKKLAEHEAQYQNRDITFTIRSGFKYNIQVSIYNFTDNITADGSLGVDASMYPAYYSQGYQGIFTANTNQLLTSNSFPSLFLEFMTYYESSMDTILTHSAPSANAYDIFIKAQSTTQNFSKSGDIIVTDTEMPFYLTDEDTAILKNTEVIESVYNQKNFWEILLEIGKYIHAIPKIRFGSNDKLLVTWTYLGQTIQNTDTTPTKMSIFNNRGIEDYVSACSSYITNMVQVGGRVDEWVAPKSVSDEYLVYNDSCDIITSKKIIEIISLDVKCISDTPNIGLPINGIRKLAGKNPETGEMPLNGESIYGYVFAKEIYQLFDVIPTTFPNKGLAIYYENGDNRIQGLNYRLPTLNTGDIYGDYAIKRILGSVFQVSENLWAKITINDFIFHVVYRTKDDIRAEQTRPDLRKYMINTSHDSVPQHYQFNNQQDIIVDSVKFGNNIYGKLIRTGNTQYTINEWVDDLYSLKEIGQLYNINDELYYITKVTNTYYSEHVTSKVEFSKDYNQLSPIIGIPSEPRFYEISEQSMVRRHVSIRDHLLIGRTSYGTDPTDNETTSYIKNINYFKNLLFDGYLNLPKYAITVFKNDIDRPYGDVIGNEEFFCEVSTPINSYTQRNTLTCEWNMIDNFSAGDHVGENIVVKDFNGGVFSADNADNAYRVLRPVKYCDSYGRADMFDFYLLNDFNTSQTGITYVLQPYADFGNVNAPVDVYVNNEIDPRIAAYLEQFEDPMVGCGLFYTYEIDGTYYWVTYRYDGQYWDYLFTQDTNTNTPPDKWLDEYNSSIGITDAQIRALPYSPLRTRLPEYKYYVSTMTKYSSDTVTDAQLTAFVETYKTLEEGDGLVLKILESAQNPTLVECYVCYYTNSTWQRKQISTDTQTIVSYETNYIGEYEDAVVVSNEFMDTSGDNKHGLILLKDNREALSFNYNISILTDSDRFVIGSNIWKPNKQNLKIATLNTEVNKFAQGTIPNSYIINKYDYGLSSYTQSVPINYILSNVDLTDVKAIAIIEDVESSEAQFADQKSFIMARNITGLAQNEAKGDWYLSFLPTRDNINWSQFYKNNQ